MASGSFGSFWWRWWVGWCLRLRASARPQKGSSTVTLVAVLEPDEGQGSGVDLTKLPIGDGKISSAPKTGYLWSCNQNYSATAGGAFRTGDWFNASAGTFDLYEETGSRWCRELAIEPVGDYRRQLSRLPQQRAA